MLIRILENVGPADVTLAFMSLQACSPVLPQRGGRGPHDGSGARVDTQSRQSGAVKSTQNRAVEGAMGDDEPRHLTKKSTVFDHRFATASTSGTMRGGDRRNDA
jgi:hypothetical protein